MKIRSKLLYYYGFIIVALLIASAISIMAVTGWSRAATRLKETHAKTTIVEKLRSNIFLQINYGLDYLYGEQEAQIRFENVHKEIGVLLDELKTDSLEEPERYFIEGFEETEVELNWIMGRFFEKEQKESSLQSLPNARDRLREIADEVADDVASLGQYYDTRENRWLRAATDAGGLAVMIIITAASTAVVLFVILAFFLQRWLVGPIAAVNQATRSIRDGNLDIDIKLKTDDEWARLAETINEMARSLKESLRKLSDQERLAALGEVSAYAAHNIRNPLSGIRAAVQVMLTSSESLPSSTRESMDEVIKTIDRLDAWLKRLLEFARPIDLQTQEEDFNKILKEAVSIAYMPFAGSPIKIDWRLAENLPPVRIDSILMEQALATIATNSFQAITSEGLVVFETSSENNGAGDDWLLVKIIDNGCGVPEHIKPRLFRIFESSKFKGTGLGLAQARRIIDIHGGTISLESETDKGTIVFIRLPLNIGDKVNNAKTEG